MTEPRSLKNQEARESLPAELQPIYDELVTDYRWATVKRYGTGYVAYSVLADLVRAGWRPSARQRKQG
ncbi:MAG: hypothetical protein HRF43_12675 [Phycisphaerae bacterium]|jgi:hypothetical protein